jgi:REP element-mobilizing transposase RayT
MNTKQPLEYDSYFHIYNRGINGEDLFLETSNYEHFLNLYSKYIDPIAETYAWCLMKNHFHFLVRIRSENEIEFMKAKEDDDRVFPKKK